MLNKKDGPAYVQFEVRSIQDRHASVEAGHYVGTDVDFAVITPPGGNTRFEQAVTDWLQGLKQQAVQGRESFYKHYNDLYEAWKQGQEVPLTGTSLKNWGGITPTELATCLSLNIRTLEELRDLSETGLQKLGMGGRSLQKKAALYLEEAQSVGTVVEKVNDLGLKLEQALAAIAEKDKLIESLKAQIPDKTLKLKSA